MSENANKKRKRKLAIIAVSGALLGFGGTMAIAIPLAKNKDKPTNNVDEKQKQKELKNKIADIKANNPELLDNKLFKDTVLDTAQKVAQKDNLDGKDYYKQVNKLTKATVNYDKTYKMSDLATKLLNKLDTTDNNDVVALTTDISNIVAKLTKTLKEDFDNEQVINDLTSQLETNIQKGEAIITKEVDSLDQVVKDIDAKIENKSPKLTEKLNASKVVVANGNENKLSEINKSLNDLINTSYRDELKQELSKFKTENPTFVSNEKLNNAVIKPIEAIANNEDLNPSAYKDQLDNLKKLNKLANNFNTSMKAQDAINKLNTTDASVTELKDQLEAQNNQLKTLLDAQLTNPTDENVTQIAALEETIKANITKANESVNNEVAKLDELIKKYESEINSRSENFQNALNAGKELVAKGNDNDLNSIANAIKNIEDNSYQDKLKHELATLKANNSRFNDGGSLHDGLIKPIEKIANTDGQPQEDYKVQIERLKAIESLEDYLNTAATFVEFFDKFNDSGIDTSEIAIETIDKGQEFGELLSKEIDEHNGENLARIQELDTFFKEKNALLNEIIKQEIAKLNDEINNLEAKIDPRSSKFQTKLDEAKAIVAKGSDNKVIEILNAAKEIKDASYQDELKQELSKFKTENPTFVSNEKLNNDIIKPIETIANNDTLDPSAYKTEIESLKKLNQNKENYATSVKARRVLNNLDTTASEVTNVKTRIETELANLENTLEESRNNSDTDNESAIAGFNSNLETAITDANTLIAAEVTKLNDLVTKTKADVETKSEKLQTALDAADLIIANQNDNKLSVLAKTMDDVKNASYQDILKQMLAKFKAANPIFETDTVLHSDLLQPIEEVANNDGLQPEAYKAEIEHLKTIDQYKDQYVMFSKFNTLLKKLNNRKDNKDVNDLRRSLFTKISDLGVKLNAEYENPTGANTAEIQQLATEIQQGITRGNDLIVAETTKLNTAIEKYETDINPRSTEFQAKLDEAKAIVAKGAENNLLDIENITTDIENASYRDVLRNALNTFKEQNPNFVSDAVLNSTVLQPIENVLDDPEAQPDALQEEIKKLEKLNNFKDSYPILLSAKAVVKKLNTQDQEVTELKDTMDTAIESLESKLNQSPDTTTEDTRQEIQNLVNGLTTNIQKANEMVTNKVALLNTTAETAKTEVDPKSDRLNVALEEATNIIAKSSENNLSDVEEAITKIKNISAQDKLKKDLEAFKQTSPELLTSETFMNFFLLPIEKIASDDNLSEKQYEASHSRLNQLKLNKNGFAASVDISNTLAKLDTDSQEVVDIANALKEINKKLTPALINALRSTNDQPDATLADIVSDANNKIAEAEQLIINKVDSLSSETTSAKNDVPEANRTPRLNEALTNANAIIAKNLNNKISEIKVALLELQEAKQEAIIAMVPRGIPYKEQLKTEIDEFKRNNPDLAGNSEFMAIVLQPLETLANRDDLEDSEFQNSVGKITRMARYADSFTQLINGARTVARLDFDRDPNVAQVKPLLETNIQTLKTVLNKEFEESNAENQKAIEAATTNISKIIAFAQGDQIFGKYKKELEDFIAFTNGRITNKSTKLEAALAHAQTVVDNADTENLSTLVNEVTTLQEAAYQDSLKALVEEFRAPSENVFMSDSSFVRDIFTPIETIANDDDLTPSDYKEAFTKLTTLKSYKDKYQTLSDASVALAKLNVTNDPEVTELKNSLTTAMTDLSNILTTLYTDSNNVNTDDITRNQEFVRTDIEKVKTLIISKIEKLGELITKTEELNSNQTLQETTDALEAAKIVQNNGTNNNLNEIVAKTNDLEHAYYRQKLQDDINATLTEPTYRDNGAFGTFVTEEIMNSINGFGVTTEEYKALANKLEKSKDYISTITTVGALSDLLLNLDYENLPLDSEKPSSPREKIHSKALELTAKAQALNTALTNAINDATPENIQAKDEADRSATEDIENAKNELFIPELTKLQETITSAEELGNDSTPKIQTALNEAKEVMIGKDNATFSEIYKANNDLKAAIAPFHELKAFEKDHATLLTNEAFERYLLTPVKEVIDNPTSTNEDIEAALHKLELAPTYENAYNKINDLNGILSRLDIPQIREQVEGPFITPLIDGINMDLQNIYNGTATPQDGLNSKLEQVTTVINAIKTNVIYNHFTSRLEDVIGGAETGVQEKDFDLENSLREAKELVSNIDNARISQIQNKTNELTKFYRKGQLRDFITKVKTENADLTSNSEFMSEVIEPAERVLNDPGSTTENYKAAHTKIFEQSKDLSKYRTTTI
ncbi:hypothetical protein H9M94_00775 [Mycoplasma sp. Pen4]|uniref:hypothetical protein n=1 Tax=Mycoplasma sp. Pen4 TaxID=640330 RepID=UPI001654174A|nr:hypothetical protein [Mycoplasma sp. Pen4]QNM93795.1 hypothetical protein H9M94_00775 [Mycoplasma sp. Pen4]